MAFGIALIGFGVLFAGIGAFALSMSKINKSNEEVGLAHCPDCGAIVSIQPHSDGHYNLSLIKHNT